MRIGVIADTHGVFDRAILDHFSGVEHILHAGDIGGYFTRPPRTLFHPPTPSRSRPALLPWDARLSRGVIAQLEAIAPVTAVSGNVDGFEECGVPGETIVALGGKRIALRHILYEGGRLTGEGRAFLDRTRPDICIFGHTHQQKAEWLGAILLFNPGSAGPKRFSLPRSVGILVIEGSIVTPSFVPLPERPV